MMHSNTPESEAELPAVDERVVAPESGYEIIDGKLVYVPPADEPHAATQAHLLVLLHAHRADGYSVACDMLTRTSRIDDFAPDASVYPTARNPRTGGRQLEELAFEVVSTQSLGDAGHKASKLVARGVRRVFAIDVERMRALEWSHRLDTWAMLDHEGVIEDRALAIPIPVASLVEALVDDDDVIVRAYRRKRHAQFIAERAEGRAEGVAQGKVEGTAHGKADAVLLVLAARGLAVSDEQHGVIAAERDLVRLDRWLAAVATCASVAELLALA